VSPIFCEAEDFVTGRLLDNVYPHQHRLLFVFTNDSTHANTSESCREWMQAIDDSLDEKVNEKEYTNPSIQEMFKVIEKEKITPEERARMKEEYNQEKAEKRSFKKGKKEGNKETARNLKALGTLTMEQIASATGLTLKVVKAL
jgi:predicted transposase/invertase (TIGR01784 family)